MIFLFKTENHRTKGELKLITIVWRSWELALLEEVTLS